jgi:hypothetical protein
MRALLMVAVLIAAAAVALVFGLVGEAWLTRRENR